MCGIIWSYGCWTKNRGKTFPPKWMVYFREKPIKHGMIWWETPLFLVQHPYFTNLNFPFQNATKIWGAQVGSWGRELIWPNIMYTRKLFEQKIPSLKLTARPWKWMVGILVSFWDGLFSGAMLVSGRVNLDVWWPNEFICDTRWWLNQPSWKICLSRIGSFPPFLRGWKLIKYVKPPTSHPRVW